MPFEVFGYKLKYKRHTELDHIWRARIHRYLESLKSVNFAKSPDLKKYFVHDFFIDAEVLRCELIDFKDAILELYAITPLNNVQWKRGELGLEPLKNWDKQDFTYVCQFKNVAHFSSVCDLEEQVASVTNRIPAYIYGALSRKLGSLPALPYVYTYGEIMDSTLRRSLMDKLSRHLFHLRFETAPFRLFDIVFEKVVVSRKSQDKYEKYTNGKKVKLSCLA